MITDSTKIAQLKALALADPVASTYFDGLHDQELADWFNQATSYVVWKSSTPASDVFDSIAWASLTPNDAPDGTAAYTNRALACQGKQFNIQLLTMGREQIASNKANVRNGIKDALQNVPAGAGGAMLDAGWAAVKTVMTRTVTRAEQLWATGTGTFASPGALTFEGLIDWQTASWVRA